VHEFSVGVLVSALRPFDELRLIEWSAHHRGYYTAGSADVPVAFTRTESGEASSDGPAESPPGRRL